MLAGGALLHTSEHKFTDSVGFDGDRRGVGEATRQAERIAASSGWALAGEAQRDWIPNGNVSGLTTLRRAEPSHQLLPAANMPRTRPDLSFRTGVASRRLVICLACSMDDDAPTEPYSPIYFFDLRRPQPWLYNEHDFVIPSLCLWRDPAWEGGRGIFVALGEDGNVTLLDSPHKRERIQDAGLASASSKGYGYLNDIQQIGAHLYACGHAGQVYRRDGDDAWVHMDQGLLQDADADGARYFAQVINGPHEQAIYVAGSESSPGSPPRADFWDGQQWRRLPLPPTAGRITNIHVESEDRILMCGANGTLLAGNARDGFVVLGAGGDAPLFTSVTKFGDAYYLGSNLGLFQLDATSTTASFTKVRTNLDPELVDANIAQSAEDVLWSIGTKDIARFDGTSWERFHHPNNPPILPAKKPRKPRRR